MRRSASEVIRELEDRVALLEKSASETEALTPSEVRLLNTVIANGNELMSILIRHGINHPRAAKTYSTAGTLGILFNDIHIILQNK